MWSVGMQYIAQDLQTNVTGWSLSGINWRAGWKPVTLHSHSHHPGWWATQLLGEELMDQPLVSSLFTLLAQCNHLHIYHNYHSSNQLCSPRCVVWYVVILWSLLFTLTNVTSVWQGCPVPKALPNFNDEMWPSFPQLEGYNWCNLVYPSVSHSPV